MARTAPDSAVGGDLSGYWNDIDARQVADSMIVDCLGRSWIDASRTENGNRKPVIKLMGVIKRTDDPNVRTSFFTKQIERALLNSGRVRVVASFGQDLINVVERGRQSIMASEESAKSHGQELAPDFTLQTFVNSQNETDGENRTVRAYLVSMEMVSVEGNEKVWIGQERIRKIVVGGSKPTPNSAPKSAVVPHTAEATKLASKLRGAGGALKKGSSTNDIATASQAAIARLHAAAESKNSAGRRGSGILDKWSPAIFKYLLFKTHEEAPNTPRQRETAFLFGSVCAVSAMPFSECIALGIEGDRDKIKNAFGLTDTSLAGFVDAEKDSRRLRMASLSKQDLVSCKVDRVLGSYDPNASEEDLFAAVTAKSRTATYWRHKVRRFHSVSFDCGEQVGLFIFTDYKDQAALRIFGWKFIGAKEWAQAGSTAESAFIQAAGKL